MRIVIRCDASLTIGHGHVIRCLTLASALREHGASILFVCRVHAGHLCELIEERGFAVNRLVEANTAIPVGNNCGYDTWLGVSWQEDANQTLNAIEAEGGRRPSWLVVDHYAIDERWERKIRPAVNKIFVVDDLANRNHECDLLLDQNFVADMDNRYAAKVPAHCGLLLGAAYLLLQPIYTKLRAQMLRRQYPVKRLLIYFGGADSENLTGRAVNAFLSLNIPEIEVDVVISDINPYKNNLCQLIGMHKNIHLHTSLPSLALLMTKADLAIGATGATSWERLCLGLFTLVITLADNQREVAEKLNQLGLVRWLGYKDEVSEEKIRVALKMAIDDQSCLNFILESSVVIDGLGSNRVSDLLLGRRLGRADEV